MNIFKTSSKATAKTKTAFLSASLSSLVASLSLGLLMASGSAQAHDDAYLDTVKTPHGGQLRMAGMYHFELVVVKDSKVAKNNPVIVYVTDHAGQAIPTAGASGTASILSGKNKVTAKLLPDGDNRLKGSASYASDASMKGLLSVTMPGKPAEQARFTPMAIGQDEHMHHTK